MKSALTSLLGMIAVLTAFSACRMTQEQEPESGKTDAGKVYPVHFVAAEIESRTVFGEAVSAGGGTMYPTLWSPNDSQVAVSLNLNPAKSADVTPAEDYITATFEAGFSESEVSAPYTFYALTPYSAYVGATSDHGGYHFHIPTEQTPLATSCDERAQVMAASQSVAKIADFNSVELHFNHLTAYGKMTLKNMTLPEGAEILSIDLTASKPFTGQFYYDFENGILEEGSPSRTVTLNPANISFDAGTSSDIWFACAPADLGGGTLKVDVNTSAGILSRTVELGEGKLAFQRGHVSKFGINMTDAVFTQSPDRWVLVTDASTLAAGDEIIIANSASSGAAYALSTTQNADNRGRAAISIDQDTDGKMIIQSPGTAIEVLTLVAGAYPDYFYLKETTTTTGRYLGTTGDSYGNSNYLRSNEISTATNDSNKGYHNWTFSIASDKVAYITAYQSSSGWGGNQNYKHLRYSESSKCFSAYVSSSRTSWSSYFGNSQSVYVYRREAGVNVHDDPILEQDAYGAYLVDGNRVFGAGDQLSREYIGNGTVTFAILTPTAYEIAEFNGIPINPAKGDSFTLNYNLISGRNRSDTDYSVTVVKVDGPKVWLSTGDGYGFIVKK